MLDSILNIVKDKAMDVISNNAGVPEEKKQDAVQTTTHALADGLKQNLNLNNLSALSGLFGGGDSASANPIVNNIQSTVVNELTSKVGLSQGIATTIASTVISAVMSVLSKKVSDPNEKGFNLESIVGAFTGGNHSGTGSSGAGDLLGSLGKLFK